MFRTLALLLALIAAPAAAQQPGKPIQCGPATVGAASVAITFPAAGSGPSYPSYYILIQSPSANYLCVNPTGGTAATAAAGCAAGNIYLNALSSPLIMSGSGTGMPPPAAPTVVASAAGTLMTCLYQ